MSCEKRCLAARYTTTDIFGDLRCSAANGRSGQTTLPFHIEKHSVRPFENLRGRHRLARQHAACSLQSTSSLGKHHGCEHAKLLGKLTHGKSLVLSRDP